MAICVLFPVRYPISSLPNKLQAKAINCCAIGTINEYHSINQCSVVEIYPAPTSLGQVKLCGSRIQPQFWIIYMLAITSNMLFSK
uniref:Uncharacterized protein n=1 Tax=Rhizophora mucronata TaxID=61149 RepID=A0A2P2QRI8_RHIMU